MFWLIILIIIAGAALIKLGALSVLVTVLAVSLKVVIGLILALTSLLTWRWWRSRKIYTPWRKL